MLDKNKNSSSSANRWLLLLSRMSAFLTLVMLGAGFLAIPAIDFGTGYSLLMGLANASLVFAIYGMAIIFGITMSLVLYGMAHLLASYERVRELTHHNRQHLEALIDTGASTLTDDQNGMIAHNHARQKGQHRL
jgi:hypothetical protein